MGFPDYTKEYGNLQQGLNIYGGALHRGYPQILAVYERGAVDNKEKIRAALARPDGHVEINKGFAFHLYRLTSQPRFIFEAGALHDPDEDLSREMVKPIALIAINQGYRFEVIS